MPLAMHMANELLNLPTAMVTLALAAVAVGIASAIAARKIDPHKLPLMGVIGAFVFAGQMINFTLPGMPGTSGHLGGGVLLAILLGPSAGIVVMTAVLIVQCLLFQDGGLLALGCNIINMGVIPCVLGGWLYQAMLGRRDSSPAWRQYLSAWVACVVALTAGAAMVPIETAFGGRLMIPVRDFSAVMVSVHLVIGLIEGLITFAVLAYVRQVRPDVLGLADATDAAARSPLSGKAFAFSLLLTAVMLAGVVSWFASTHPDGLEWAYQQHKYAVPAELPVKPATPAIVAVDDWQSRWALLSDYGKRPAPLGQTPPCQTTDAQAAAQWGQPDGWRSMAGIAGTFATLLLLFAVTRLLRRRKPAADA